MPALRLVGQPDSPNGFPAIVGCVGFCGTVGSSLLKTDRLTLLKLAPLKNVMAKLFIPLITAVWVGVIALVAIQNAAPITFQFLGFQSIQIPIGLVLAFSGVLGMAGTALVLPLGGRD